ncbi:MAG: hypothetical protein ABWZ67_07600 [Solirubrobacteraceae bacterium]
MTRIARACALLALALLTALAIAAAPAFAKDGGAKVMPKRWAKQHKARGGAKADPDDDGLSNWGEWRARTKPRKADTDRDGIGDGEEDRDGDRLDNASELAVGTDPRRRDSDRDGVADGDEDRDGDGLSNADEDAHGTDPRRPDGLDGLAGTVAASDGATLTIALARGGTVSGAVDGDTEVYCDVQGGYEDENDEEDAVDGDRFTVAAHLAEEGDEDDAGDEDWSDEDDADCAAELVPGAIVHEAELEDGRFWTVELVLAD